MIKLERFKMSDCKELISWVESEKMLIQFAGTRYSFPLTEAQIKNDLEDINRFAFLVKNENNHSIGHAQLLLQGNSFLLCRILIADKNLRGKGLGQQLIYKLLNFGFNKLNLEKAELNVYDWNINAIKCYEKVGFKIVPNLTSEVKVSGETWKAIRMSIDKSNFEK